MSPHRLGRILAGSVAAAAALAALLAGRWAGRRYEREFQARLGAAVAAYLAVVTPPAPGDSDLDLAKLLIHVRGLAAVPTLATGLEVYHGTTPLLDSRSAPLPVQVLDALRERDVAQDVGPAAVNPLKDRDDWNVIGAVAVEPAGDRVTRGALGGWVPLALLVWLGGLVWVGWALRAHRVEGKRHFRAALGGSLVGAVLVGAAAAANASASGRAATDRWLTGTRLLIEEAAHRLPAKTVDEAITAFSSIARGAELVPGDSDSFAAAREVVAGAPRARVAVRLGHGHWLALRALPLETGSGGWLGLTLGLALLGPAALALLRWTERMRARPRGLRETVTAWGFLAPAALHLAVFSFAPMLFALYLSVHRWSPIEPVRPFVGLANFMDIARDPLVWTSLRNTLLYTLHVPIAMALALAVALALTSGGRLVRLVRTAFFLPYVSSVVAIALVWQWIYHPDFGLLNYALQSVGLGPFDWLGNPRTALLAVMGISVWVQVGYQMVVFLAGLQGIPQDYLDAARVDGAGAWRRFWRITFPLLRPVTLFVLVTGIITSFQVFTFVYVLTDGGPLHATDVIVYRIYQIAWEFQQFGRASALALFLFLLLLGLTWTQFRLLDRRGDHVA